MSKSKEMDGDSDSGINEDETEDDDPELYVVAIPVNSTATSSRLLGGVYFGTWLEPDMLSSKFPDEAKVVSVEDISQADAACEQLQAPYLFRGPRSFEHLEHQAQRARSRASTSWRRTWQA